MSHPSSRSAARLLPALAALLAVTPVQAELVDRVAVVVNNEIITQSEVMKRAAGDFQRLEQEAKPDDRQKRREEITRRTLDLLIDEKVLDQELRESKITIDDKQIDASMAEVMKRYNFTADQLAQAVANEGLTLAEYREQMRKQLGRYQILREKVQKKIKVSEADIRSEYDRMGREEGKEMEAHVRHIVINVSDKATPEAVEAALVRAKAITAEARQPGVDFAQLARQKSEGSSAADGGDLGFFKHGAMVPAFEQMAFSLKPGEVGDPVRTSLGWHVIKLEELRAVGLPPLAELKPQIEDKLRGEQAARASAQYIQTLRQAAVIDMKMFPPTTSASAESKPE